MSQSSNLRSWYIFLWVIDGWWHGTVIYFVCFYVMGGGMIYSDASFVLPGTSYAAVDYNMLANACYIYVVVTSTMRIVIMSRTLNLIIIVGLFVTGFANLGVMFIYQVRITTSSFSRFWITFPLEIRAYFCEHFSLYYTDVACLTLNNRNGLKTTLQNGINK